MEDKKPERVSIFIDGSNFYHSLKTLNISKSINFKNLIEELRKDRLLINVFYYNAPLDKDINSDKYWKQQKFFDILRKIPGFKVILCRVRKDKKEDGSFKFTVKGDDIHLASDLIGMAYENLYDTAIIVSGDGDFVPAIQRVQKLKKKVENVYFSSSFSSFLKKVCNSSLCIDKIIQKYLIKKIRY